MNRKNIIITVVSLSAMSRVAIAFFTSIVAVNDRLDEELHGTHDERVKAAMDHRC